MQFQAQSQQQLQAMQLDPSKEYNIEYLERDYFNAELTIKQTKAKVIINEDQMISFMIQDDYGMDKFINEAKVISQ